MIQDAHDLAISYEPVRLTKPIEHFDTVNWMAEGGEDSQDSGIAVDKVGWQAIFLCAPELDLLIHALQPLLRISPRAFRELTVSGEGNARSAMNMILSALIAAARADDESASSRRQANQWLTTYSSPFAYLLTSSAAISEVPEVWSKSASSRALVSAATNTDYSVWTATNTAYNVYGSAYNSVINAGTINLSVSDREIDEFAILRLLLSAYSRLSELKQSLPDLGDISRIYSKVNPIALASEDGAFITEVFRVARLNALRDWAALQGLAVLAVLNSDKLATLSQEDVEFVLTSSTSNPSQAQLIALIRDRYDYAVHHQ